MANLVNKQGQGQAFTGELFLALCLTLLCEHTEYYFQRALLY